MSADDEEQGSEERCTRGDSAPCRRATRAQVQRPGRSTIPEFCSRRSTHGWTSLPSRRLHPAADARAELLLSATLLCRHVSVNVPAHHVPNSHDAGAEHRRSHRLVLGPDPSMCRAPASASISWTEAGMPEQRVQERHQPLRHRGEGSPHGGPTRMSESLPLDRLDALPGPP